MQEVHQLTYERVDTSKDAPTNAKLFLAGIFIIAGIVGAFDSKNWVRLGFSIFAITAGIILYIYLFRTAPQTKYFRYFWADGNGICHVTNSDPNCRVSRFAWSEIVKVELINRDIEEVTGIKIYVNRPMMHDVPIYLEMVSDHAAQSTKVIEKYLKSLVSQTSNLLLHTV